MRREETSRVTSLARIDLFCEEIYCLTAQFPKNEIYALTSQMRRAAVSIPRQYYSDKEFLQFLCIAVR